MSRAPFDITPTDMSAATTAMVELTAAGRGWLDLIPAGAEPPRPTSVWGRIDGRGPSVPRLTWTAPRTDRRKPEPAALGIEHATGIKAIARLTASGHPLPEGWRRLQDHPMRGLVVEPAADADPAAVLAWGLRAVVVLGAADPDGWTVQVLGID
jgi:hypothetical protein